MTKQILNPKSQKPNLKLLPGIQKNVSLARHTTFRIGGPAKYFFVAKTKYNLIKVARWAKNNRVPFFILGGGSNVLVSDDGYKGIVIKSQKSKVKRPTVHTQQNYNSKFKIFCESGTPLAKLVNEVSRLGAAGAEWAAGIPGTVGGAIFGNSSAFDGSMGGIIEEVEVYDATKNKIYALKNKKCSFGNKTSIFKKNKNLIILSAILKVKKGRKAAIQKKIKEHLAYRKERHPLNFPSAGCVFINPVFSSAGQLIEKSGLKGKTIGGAQISEKHANFIINLGGAKTKEVIQLIKLAKKKVKENFGVKLQEEIQYL